jgi:hypothetical protein
MNCIRCTQRQTNHFFSFESVKYVDLLLFFSKFLISHIVSWSFATNKNLIVLHINGYIVTWW